MRIVVVVNILACVAFAPAAAQAPVAEHALVLATTYGDGRTTHAVVTAKGRRAWTPLFLRVPGARPSRGELPVHALNYRSVLQDGAVVIDVSVLRGEAHEQEDHVAQVVVRPGEIVTVEELRAFGVSPVTFSTVPLPPSMLYPPQVLNRTAGLEVVDIEVMLDPSPTYRVVVRNVSSRAAVNFHVITHYAGRPSMSGYRGNPDSTPIIDVGGIYSFSWPPARITRSSSGEITVASHDLLEIAAVLWQDGEIEGNAGPMGPVLAMYQSRAWQLARAIEVLKAAQGRGTGDVRLLLRGQIQRLSTQPDAALVKRVRERLRHVGDVVDTRLRTTIQTTLAAVRRGVLEDVDEAPQAAEPFRQWILDIIALYEQQARRLAAR